MRFLADESCDFAVVRALRAAGHDVLAVAELSPRADDPSVIRLTMAEERILLTEDRDFGRLVFAQHAHAHGVLYLRYPIAARDHIAKAVVRLAEREGDALKQAFAVVRPGRIRIVRTGRE